MKCEYYREYGKCAKNNDEDNLGDCVYDDGIIKEKSNIHCSEGKKINKNQEEQYSKIRKMSPSELLSLIGKPIYAIRNCHKGDNHRNFYISTMKIKNIILSTEGILIDTGFEIFHESEMGNRFSLDNKEIQKSLEYVKSQQFDNISQIFKMHVIDRNLLLTR